MVHIYKSGFYGVSQDKVRLSLIIISAVVCVTAPIQTRAEIRKVTILQTTDIHCELESWRKDTPHGWFKVGTLVKQERNRAGKENTLLIDCGDTIQGSLVASQTKGAAAVKLLNLLKYDVWVIGNHEFDYGLKTLNNRINEVTATPLLANITYPRQSNKFKPWKIFTKNGVRIAVIGIGCPDTPDRIWERKLKGLKIQSIEESIGRTIPSVMRARPDMIILAMHYGQYGAPRDSGNYIHKIIRKYPQIDLVLGGHMHSQEPGTKIGKSTWFTQSGSHGKYISRVTATVDIKKHRVANISSRLIAVKESTSELSTMRACVKNELKRTKKFSWNTVGKLGHSIAPLAKRKSNSGLSELYSKAISTQHKVNIVLQSASSDYGLPAGKITEWNLFRAYPFEDTVCLLNLTKQQLKEIIQEQLDKDRDKRFLSPYGVIITTDKDNKITKITLENGSRWKSKQRQTVAINSYSIAGAGRRFPILKKIAMMKPVNARDTKQLVRDAIRKHLNNSSPTYIKVKQRISAE